MLHQDKNHILPLYSSGVVHGVGPLAFWSAGKQLSFLPDGILPPDIRQPRARQSRKTTAVLAAWGPKVSSKTGSRRVVDSYNGGIMDRMKEGRSVEGETDGG